MLCFSAHPSLGGWLLEGARGRYLFVLAPQSGEGKEGQGVPRAEVLNAPNGCEEASSWSVKFAGGP